MTTPIPTPADVERVIALIRDVFGPARRHQHHHALDNARLWTDPAYRAAATREGAPGHVLECRDHERDLQDCLRAGLTCRGIPVPTRSDPTGAAATAHDPELDHARALVEDYALQLELLEATVRRFRAAFLRLSGTRVDSRGLEVENAPLCTSCYRNNGHRTPATTRTDAGGQLAEKLQLCRWCADFAREHGTLPTLDQVRAHHQGRTVRLKAPDEGSRHAEPAR